ncbi:MAG: AAA family ATPase [Chloroflexi bacterium]|nr:AAA family ATPase [Chloroflexota bacterium]
MALPLTTFVGRQREVARLEHLLSSTRLLTLVGPGGVGKTRLAVKLMTESAHDYADGARLVELEALTDPELVVHAMASALGLGDQTGLPLLNTLLDVVRDKHLLLVLDNCEHVAAACAEMVYLLLATSPRLRIMATSRAPLNVDGETTWLVPPLEVPTPETPVGEQMHFDAVQLFLERACSVRPDFELTDDNRDAVAAICRVLDGIPLALELAAARLRALATDEILARLSTDLSLLVSNSRTLPQRQRTLRTTQEWSYNLLGEAERQAFERLSVFAGSWTLEAAEVVCSGDGIDRESVLDLVASLVDKSLVLMDARHGPSRYRLLRPLQQFAFERLEQRGPAEMAGVRNRHAEFFVGLATRSFAPNWEASAEQLAQVGYRRDRLEHLEGDHDNFRSALGWLVANESVDAAQRLGAGLWQFWLLRNYLTEGRTWLQRILQLPGGDASTRIRLLLGAGFLAFRHDAVASEGSLAEEALSLAQQVGDTAGMALALYRLGDVARASGDHVRACALLDEAINASRDADNASLEAFARTARGSVAMAEGDLESARAVLIDAMAGFRHGGNRYGLAVCARRLGAVLYRLGEYTEGCALLEESLAGLRDFGDVWHAAIVLWELSMIAIEQQDTSRAWDVLNQGLRLCREVGDQGRVSWFLQGLACLAASQHQPVRALRLASAASSLAARNRGAPEATRSGLPYSWQFSVVAFKGAPGVLSLDATGGYLGAARKQLGGSAADQAWSDGARLSLAEAIEYALTPEPSLVSATARNGVNRFGLTPREFQVLQLVSEGKTNRQIADELVLSDKTVKRHLDNVFSKLGVSSRAAATAAMLRHQP